MKINPTIISTINPKQAELYTTSLFYSEAHVYLFMYIPSCTYLLPHHQILNELSTWIIGI